MSNVIWFERHRPAPSIVPDEMSAESYEECLARLAAAVAEPAALRETNARRERKQSGR